MSEFQKEQGYRWVPLSEVPTAKLHEYRYWNERP
jgi:hypothetical protein